MPRPRYVPNIIHDYHDVPFSTAEEAWFWYIRAQKARRDGLRFDGPRLHSRPCDPDDIYRTLISLRQGGKVRRAHVDVLARFGFREQPPDPRCRDEQVPARLWDEALDRMATVLRRKGIIDAGADDDPRFR